MSRRNCFSTCLVWRWLWWFLASAAGTMANAVAPIALAHSNKKKTPLLVQPGQGDGNYILGSLIRLVNATYGASLLKLMTRYA